MGVGVAAYGGYPVADDVEGLGVVVNFRVMTDFGPAGDRVFVFFKAYNPHVLDNRQGSSWKLWAPVQVREEDR